LRRAASLKMVRYDAPCVSCNFKSSAYYFCRPLVVSLVAS
jgi:hypothetical protein